MMTIEKKVNQLFINKQYLSTPRANLSGEIRNLADLFVHVVHNMEGSALIKVNLNVNT